ncbi:NAD(P)H-binding protein [Nocardia sp. CDC159]|nr:NAD(P)H-binding protein [Nocardia sp. CDC159]
MKILVTGATGNIGRKVVERLLAMGCSDLRALTNDPGRAALPAGVEVVEGYLGRVETLPAALEGVERMYLAPVPETVGRVMEMVRRAGVRHVVDLSGEPHSWWASVGAAVEDSGVAWTHLWPWDFMENTLIWAEQIRETGAVREPWPDAASAPIAMADIARVAATVLTTDGHVGQAYSLAGPQILSRAELVRGIGRACGRDIPFIRVSPQEAIEVLSGSMGAEAAWYVENVLAGFDEHPEAPTGIVEQLTGCPARTFDQWAVEHLADFSSS